MALGARVSWLVMVVAAAAAAAVPDHGSEDPTAAECLAFLRDHMPDSDKSSPNITDSFLSQNVDLALQARAATPWGKSVPKAIFRSFNQSYHCRRRRRQRRLPCRTPTHRLLTKWLLHRRDSE
eukprot:COSAG02_NODE_5873_length_3972_cov_20.899045_2_plen_123_part_00